MCNTAEVTIINNLTQVKMDTQEKKNRLMKKYQEKFYAEDFMLPLPDALHLLGDLADMRANLYGIDFFRYDEDPRSVIVSDMWDLGHPEYKAYSQAEQVLQESEDDLATIVFSLDEDYTDEHEALYVIERVFERKVTLDWHNAPVKDIVRLLNLSFHAPLFLEVQGLALKCESIAGIDIARHYSRMYDVLQQYELNHVFTIRLVPIRH